MAQSSASFEHSRLAYCLIVAIGLLAYWPLLQYPVSNGDSVALLIGSRVESLADLVPIFTTRLMADSAFPGDFYRPIARLSYAADQWLWGDRWIGSFATNIALQLLGALVVYRIARRLFSGAATALLAALVFLLHPLAMEVVPSVDRRQDLLAGVCALVAIDAVLRWRDRRRRRWLLVAAIFYGAALGSKEIAIVVPMIVVPLVLLPDGARPLMAGLRERIRDAVIVGATLTVVLAAYLLARQLVLEGVGGYAGGFSLGRAVHTSVKFLHRLFVPQGWRVVDTPSEWVRLLGLVLAIVVGLALVDGARRTTGWRRAWLVLWALSPLLVCIATNTLSVRSFYSAVAPVSILLAHLVVASVRERDASTGTVLSRPLGAIALALSIALVAFSPLLHRYDHWRSNAEALATLLDTLTQDVAAETYAEATSVELLGVPSFRDHYAEHMPAATTVPIFSRYVIATFLADRGHRLRISRIEFDERHGAFTDTGLATARLRGDVLELRFRSSLPGR